MPDLDGALVGGASLDAEALRGIVRGRRAARVSDGQRPVVLCVLDGFGLGDDPARNALLSAWMPTWRRLTAEWPTCRLEASGEAVGLPAGQMGNTEVGPPEPRAPGFRVLQDLPRINAAIADGSFFENPVLLGDGPARSRRRGAAAPDGPDRPGGVHAVDEHLFGPWSSCAREGLRPNACFHAFTDGRDTPPR